MDREGQAGEDFSHFRVKPLPVTGFQHLIRAHLPGQRDRSLED